MKRLLAAAALLTVGAAGPDALHLNQLGFLPDTAKRAILADPATTPLVWSVVDAAGRPVAHGESIVFGETSSTRS